LLVLGTLVYNAVEAGVALWAGMRAGSIALVGFGLDSVIELSAAVVVLWRLRLERTGAVPERLEHAEARVRRFVGGTFLLLALYVTVESAWRLISGQTAGESAVGLILAVASLVIMPLLAAGKLRAARHIGSRALRAEAAETLACAYLSLVLFLGLAANAWLGWWWADAAGALLMVPWLVREGRENLSED
jgi:divalent metal cation (Fe/Co/Zn/Cd) transporter